MLKNIRKYLEYLFFILINLVLTFVIYCKLFLFLINYVYYKISTSLRVANDILLYDDPTILILFFSISLSLFIFKVIILQVLYISKRGFPYIHNFLKYLRINKSFRIKVLFCAFLIDAICCVISKNGFSLLLGLILNYLLFLLIFPPFEKRRTNSDELGIIITKIGVISIFLIFLINIIFFFFPFDIFLK